MAKFNSAWLIRKRQFRALTGVQGLSDDHFNPHLPLEEIGRLVNKVFSEIAEALARGDRVELRGFGAFTVRTRGARVGRNPKTGETVSVNEKQVPFFKAGKSLRLGINGRT